VNFLFGQFELDLDHYRLRREGTEVPLQPKVFDVIRFLVEHHDRIVHKEDLLKAIWSGEHVNETAVPWTISRARRALGQRGDAKDPIETVRGLGYRFTWQVSRVQPLPLARPPSGIFARADAGTASSPEIVAKLLPTPHNEPFVGRAESMEWLLGALDGVRRGRGGLRLVTGEAGVGKTRCMSEFANAARRTRIGVSSGRCLEGGRIATPWARIRCPPT
jgi:DNA-binding winged helix-turn-helix (wHTH) protein